MGNETSTPIQKQQSEQAVQEQQRRYETLDIDEDKYEQPIRRERVGQHAESAEALPPGPARTAWMGAPPRPTADRDRGQINPLPPMPQTYGRGEQFQERMQQETTRVDTDLYKDPEPQQRGPRMLESGVDETADPYQVLGLRRDADKSEIERKYRQLARANHPDKGGSPVIWEMIRRAYGKAMRQYDREHPHEHRTSQPVVRRVYDPNFDEIRGMHSTGMAPGAVPGAVPGAAPGNFNLDRFNQQFMEHRIVDPSFEQGYGTLMDNRTTATGYDPNIGDSGRTIHYDGDSDDEYAGDIVQYREPDALLGVDNLQFTPLGVGAVNDFTGSTDSLTYTDYMQAHRRKGQMIDPEKVEYRKYKSVDELKRERESLSYEMSPEQRRYIEMQKQREEEEEERRQARQREFDQRVADNFQKFNRRFITQGED